MSGTKRMSKGKKKTLSVLGVAGLSIVGTTAATTNETLAGLPLPATAPAQAFALAEEEISDVTLATFHVDKEAVDFISLYAEARLGQMRMRKVRRRLQRMQRLRWLPSVRRRLRLWRLRLRRWLLSVLGRLQALVLSYSLPSLRM